MSVLDMSAATDYLQAREEVERLEEELKQAKARRDENEQRLIEQMAAQGHSRIACGDVLLSPRREIYISVKKEYKQALVEYCEQTGLERCVDRSARIVPATLKSALKELRQHDSSDEKLEAMLNIFETYKLTVRRS